MSALGHKRTLGRLNTMSALPPKADIHPALGMSAMCQKQTSAGHSITSSARCCRLNRTDRLSALADFKLMTVSYLFGACTGRSAGFCWISIRMRSGRCFAIAAGASSPFSASVIS